MKKRFLALLLAAALGVSLCACTPKEEDSGKLSVVCSLFPYYDFVREIGGGVCAGASAGGRRAGGSQL